MKNIILLLLTVAALAPLSAAAQNKTDGAREESIKAARQAAREELLELKSKRTTETTTNALVSAADVGEPDSFGKNAKFLGTAVTGVVYVYSSCDPAVLLTDLDLTLGADDRCLALPTPGQNVSATFTDIGRINLPRGAADNVIYYIQSNFINYDQTNSFGSPFLSNFIYSPSLTIESDALNDPAAVDPDTGQPLNGSLTVGTGSKFTRKTYAPGAQEFIVDRYATAATRGFARSYFADYGLPPRVINQLYRKPMTIKLNLRVSANLISFGQFTYSMRFLGN